MQYAEVYRKRELGRMKKFAFFLPQFYEIEDNNRWWGKGFTEWTNIRNSKSLYKGHRIQKPLDNSKYYNLLDKKTMQWQTELMYKYGIEGMIYYHYYFGNEKMIMEKPAENLLKWNDIKQPFFFCWANHSFSKVGWLKREILVEQIYGDVDEWEKHFNYLLPFFKDDRYVKDDNKPILMLFKSEFSEKNSMCEYFDTRCKDVGFDGICIIETYFGIGWPETYEKIRNDRSICTKYIYIREPNFETCMYEYSLGKLKYKLKMFRRLLSRIKFTIKPEILDGETLVKEKNKYEPFGDDIIHGFSFQWDSTPRHGRRGYVIKPVAKETFDNYMKRVENEKYFFINAWNEWSEGMILEPTDINGYKYLEWVKDWDV